MFRPAGCWNRPPNLPAAQTGPRCGASRELLPLMAKDRQASVLHVPDSTTRSSLHPLARRVASGELRIEILRPVFLTRIVPAQSLDLELVRLNYRTISNARFCCPIQECRHNCHETTRLSWTQGFLPGVRDWLWEKS